jgi:hypothetical protein
MNSHCKHYKVLTQGKKTKGGEWIKKIAASMCEFVERMEYLGNHPHGFASSGTKYN